MKHFWLATKEVHAISAKHLVLQGLSIEVQLDFLNKRSIL